MNFLNSIFKAISAVFGWFLHRSELKNTPEMREAVKRQDDQEVIKDIEQAVVKEDVEETRRKLGGTLLLCLFLALVPACTSTVRPAPVVSAAASFDGNKQTSGFIRYLPNGDGLITERGRAKYNHLIEHYGQCFLLPLKPNEGLTAFPEWNNDQNSPTWAITKEYLVKFMLMNQWNLDGRKPSDLRNR
jgi:hypothetical protein